MNYRSLTIETLKRNDFAQKLIIWVEKISLPFDSNTSYCHER